MYRYWLSIVLVGLEEDAVSAVRELKPLKRFYHEVTAFPSLQAISDEAEYHRNTFVVLNNHVDWKWDRLREIFGVHARFFLCADHADRLDAETLDRFDEIWPCPLTAALARYEVGRLQRKIKAEKDDALHRQYLDTLIDMTPDLVWFKDMPGCHLKVNQAFCEAVDKTREDVTGKFHNYIWGTSDDDEKHGEPVCNESELAVAEARHTCYFEEEVRHARRGICQLKVWKAPVYDEAGDVVGTIGLAHDVTREKEAQDKILHLAHTDALTGLFNRRYFYEYIEEQRKGKGMTICYIDLDHFKQLNDTYGHYSGDAALLGVAELLRQAFPKDFITRLGGDEFIVAILGMFHREEIMERLDDFMKSANEFFQLDECLMGLSMSIGVAMAKDSEASLEVLIQQSDAALYYSKTHGKGIYTFHEDIGKADENEKEN